MQEIYKHPKDVECPYCGDEQDIIHDDGYGYEEDKHHIQQCGRCGKKYVYFTIIDMSYAVHQADCLNNGEHIYAPMDTVPKDYTEMICQICGHVRMPTNEEREQYNIPWQELPF